MFMVMKEDWGFVVQFIYDQSIGVVEGLIK
jgi:hypothetical protein